MFILTDKKHKSGLMLNEYKGKLGILYAFQKGDKIMPFWVYRQSPFKQVALDKAMPHRVEIGTPKQAKIILQTLLKQIEEEYLSGNPKE